MKIICGVDVSKAKLDACIEPGGIFASFDNNAAGIAELAAFLPSTSGGTGGDGGDRGL